MGFLSAALMQKKCVRCVCPGVEVRSQDASSNPVGGEKVPLAAPPFGGCRL